jgi:hypothetical protein
MFLVAALPVAIGPARAADGPAAPPAAAAAPAPEIKAEARERFDRGLQLFEQGQNAGALAEFKRTYQLIPNPLVLYNMGLVYAAMNRPVQATDALDDFLRQAPGSVPAEKRKHAQGVRDEQSKRIAQLMVLTQTPATIEIDGIEAGRTPLATPIRLASGAHVVTVLAPGFLPSHKEVTLPGQTTETLSLNLLPTDSRLAQLLVKSALIGAEVLVNGKRVGVTPLAASVAVPPGQVQVQLRRAGYVPATQMLVLDEGARGELTFVLDEDRAAPATMRGRLAVSAGGPDTEISIDGGARRPIPGVLDLPIGPHLVRVSRPGYETVERTVEVQASAETPLVVVLAPTGETRARAEESHRVRRAVAWSLAGGGLALALAAGIYAGMTQGDVSDAQAQLDLVLGNERMVMHPCFNSQVPATMMDYDGRGCGTIRANAEQQLDDAELRRNWSLAGAALGVVAAGVGSYLLLSDRQRHDTAPVTVRVWGSADGGAFALSGRF